MSANQPEPQLNITPYTIATAVATVVAILASPVASTVVSPEVQSWCSLLSVVIPGIITVIFTTKTTAYRNLKAKLFHK